MPDGIPSFPSPDVLRVVREALSDAEFHETGLAQALSLSPGTSPRRLAPPVLAHRMEALPREQRTLLHLFLAGGELTGDHLRRALGAEVAEAFATAGLVESSSGSWRATVRLAAVEDRIVAEDRLERHWAREADFVLGSGGVTRRVADVMLRRPVESVLDLGCGAGTLGLLAAAHAKRVVATDVNPRAVAFARFNAELNGVTHMECREGSLFEPVAGERFDLVISNPPYVISPDHTFTYRDGGSALCRSLVRNAHGHLTDDGWLQMMVEWPERDGDDWHAEVGAWLDGVPCDAWLLRLYRHGPADYAWRWVMQEEREKDAQAALFASWTAYLAKRDVSGVGGGLLLLQPTRRARPIRSFRDAPPLARGRLGTSLERWLGAQQLLGDDDDVLLDRPLLPSPELLRSETRRPSDEGWSPAETRLRLNGGLRFAAAVDPVGVALVGLMGTDHTPRQAVEVFADRHGVPRDSLLDGLPDLLRRLLSLGILVPGEGHASSD